MTQALQTPDQTREDALAKVAELIAATKICMFTTIEPGGRIASRPVAMLNGKFDGELWFVAQGDSRKIEQVRNDAHVNVAFSTDRSWVSVAGSAEIVRDPAKAKELWGPGADAWYPEGPEAPNIVLIRVEAESVEYWDTPGAGIASVMSFVKAKTTGKPYKVENDSVEL